MWTTGLSKPLNKPKQALILFTVTIPNVLNGPTDSVADARQVFKKTHLQHKEDCSKRK